MKRLLLLLLVIALPLAAQEKKDEKSSAPPPQRAQKLFLLKYADPNSVANLLRVFGGNISPNSEMHALAVETTDTSMPAIEEAIKRLDVPAAGPKNLELTAYLMIGSAGTEPSTVPKDLDSVVTQLRNVFTFKSYRLLDVLTLRTRAGQNASTSSVAGSMQTASPNAATVGTDFVIGSASVGTDETIRIDKMRLGCRVPLPTGSGGLSYSNVGLNADVDIKQGQKVVVGRMSVGQDSALFVVLTAQVVN